MTTTYSDAIVHVDETLPKPNQVAEFAMTNGVPEVPPGNPIEVPPEPQSPDIPPGGPVELPDSPPDMPSGPPVEVPQTPDESSGPAAGNLHS